MNQIEIIHPFDEGFFLFEAGLDDASVYFFLKNEQEVIVGVQISVADEVQVIERADEGHSKLLELFVDAFLEVSKWNIELNMIYFEEIQDLKRILGFLYLGRSLSLLHQKYKLRQLQ